MAAGLLCSFLETAVKKPFPCIFQLLDTACLPWLIAPFIFRVHLCFWCHIFTDSDPHVFLLKDLCDYVGVTQDNPGHLSISRSLTWSSASPFAEPYSWVTGIGTWNLWGRRVGIVHPPHWLRSCLQVWGSLDPWTKLYPRKSTSLSVSPPWTIS